MNSSITKNNYITNHCVCNKYINYKNLRQLNDQSTHFDKFMDSIEYQRIPLKYEKIENYNNTRINDDDIYLYGFEIPQGYYITKNFLEEISEDVLECYDFFPEIDIGTTSNGNIFCGINITNTDQINTHEKLLITELRLTIIAEIEDIENELRIKCNDIEIKKYSENYNEITKDGEIKIDFEIPDIFLKDVQKIINIHSEAKKLTYSSKSDQKILYGFSLPNNFFINEKFLIEINNIYRKYTDKYLLIDGGRYDYKPFYGIRLNDNILEIEEKILIKLRDLIYEYLYNHYDIKKEIYVQDNLIFAACNKNYDHGWVIDNQKINKCQNKKHNIENDNETWYSIIEDILKEFKETFTKDDNFFIYGFNFPEKYKISEKLIDDINKFYINEEKKNLGLKQITFNTKNNICGIKRNNNYLLNIEVWILKLLKKYIDQFLSINQISNNTLQEVKDAQVTYQYSNNLIKKDKKYIITVDSNNTLLLNFKEKNEEINIQCFTKCKIEINSDNSINIIKD